MAEKAEERMSPIVIVSTTVQNRFAYGSARVNGSTPRIENQITYLRPIQSPIGPPASVPVANAPRYTNRSTCACCTGTWKWSIR